MTHHYSSDLQEEKYMIHRITVCTVTNDQARQVAFWTNEAKAIGLAGKRLTALDNICKISLARDMVILLTVSPTYRNGYVPNPDYIPDYSTYNYVDAYDYEGNHLWNIAEIIGDAGSGICDGYVCSTEYLMKGCEDTYIDGHELFVCWNEDGMRYLIDLDEKKVIHKMITR